MMELVLLRNLGPTTSYLRFTILLISLRWVPWLSIIIAIALIFYCVSLISKIQPRKTKESCETKKFKFLDQNHWLEQCRIALLNSQTLESPILFESFLISEATQDLVNLIIEQFINLWFTKISNDPLFSNSVNLELRYVIRNVKQRIARMNIPSFLVFSILPLMSKHFSSFLAMNQKHDAGYSIERKIALASATNFRHTSVSLMPPGPSSRVEEKKFLRAIVSKILPYLLSEKESQNKIVVSLTRELISCAILGNVLEVVSEGDFFNQMIVKLIGDNLQHRDQVKRLRAALKQHTMSSGDISFSELTFPISDHAVEQWLNLIKINDSRQDLENAKSMLLKYQSLSHSSTKMGAMDIRKLSMISDALDSQIAILSNGLLPLESVLSHSKLATVFREYLRQSKHELDFDLWQDIELMKAPLEDSETGQIPLMLKFSNKDDIKQIYTNYLFDRSMPVGPRLREIVATYVNCSELDPSKSSLYEAARKALFDIQVEVFAHIKESHYEDFTKSERFGDLDLAGIKHNRRIHKEPSLVFTTGSGSKPANRIISTVNTDAVEAIENAFEKIMTTRDLELQSLFGESSAGPFATDLNDSDLSLDLSRKVADYKIGDVDANRMSTLFENESDIDSDSESIHSDSGDLHLEDPGSELNSLEIILAAPGDLSLAEQIRSLDKTIENLFQQDSILASLLKKAELTNNVGELKVLRRSKSSLEREIKSKEMQKQQYIVQENENSLYGKSRVNIQSCTFGNDETTNYVLYIIEVQKYSSEDPDKIVAGWVVARRFRQFYRLNEYLKKRIPEVSRIKFPKKSVQMLNFQKRQQVESRKPILQDYLQALLQNPEVCSNSAFRSFLSSEDFHLKSSSQVIDSKKGLDTMFNKIYGGSGFGRRIQNIESDNFKSLQNKDILESIKEMEKELKQFDENEKCSSGKIPFVRPISDLLMTIFDLGNSKSWLRGRALLVILQQLLGSTIERTITQVVNTNIRLEEKIVDTIQIIKNLLFPDGKFRESPQVRTKMEQTTTRHEAMFILRSFMNETCSKLFGSRNSNRACDNIFELLQNDYLNKSLILMMFEQLVVELFPEADWSTS